MWQEQDVLYLALYLMECLQFYKHGFLEIEVLKWRTIQNRCRKLWQSVPRKTVYFLTFFRIRVRSEERRVGKECL